MCVGGCAYALICRTIRALSLPHTIRARGFTAEHLIDNRNWKCVCLCICVCVSYQHACQTQSHPTVHMAQGGGINREGETDGWKGRTKVGAMREKGF